MQFLTLFFDGESQFKKITNLPLDHEIIGVEGTTSRTGITSLSLLIAGPSMSMLSKQAKRAKLNELELMKTGFEYVKDKGLKRWAREAWHYLCMIPFVILVFYILIYGELQLLSMGENLLMVILAMIVTFVFILICSFGFLCWLCELPWVPEIKSPVILSK